MPRARPSHQDGGSDQIDVTNLSGELADGQKALPGFSGYTTTIQAIPGGGADIHMDAERFAHDTGDYTWVTTTSVTIV